MKNKVSLSKTLKSMLPLFIIPVLFFMNCTFEPHIEPPSSMRFSTQITIRDTTAGSRDSLVAGASVVLQSITYGDYRETLTDSFGVAFFQDIIPDRYNVLATGRRVSITEMININGQLQDTSLYIENNDTLRLEIIAQTSLSSPLVISEIYYSGAPPRPVPQYFHDQFLEIYNNSDMTLYLDSLIIADVEYGFRDDSLIHAIHTYMFPGSGTDYPIEPGQCIVIAQDAIDHSLAPINSVNLLNADFEYYVPQGGDVDNPNVPNMIQLHHKYGIDFLYSVFRDALVIMQVRDPFALGYDGFNRLLLPKSGVIDGVEYRDNTSQLDMKRLDASIDAGLAGGIPSYSGKSIERRIEEIKEGRIILMDNNNSSLDFHILETPTPGYIATTEAE